jgi:hypothetical protein
MNRLATCKSRHRVKDDLLPSPNIAIAAVFAYTQPDDRQHGRPQCNKKRWKRNPAP